ncbi:putative RNA polymerase, sigma-24 subunit, ECF subfamily [Candidatus Zixiibacteriota bacterium]|nr:putative RNA polymerase, sigma-24 subunit, ECF subfamily [candidate division Zixibacteria bacterium]
MQVDCDKFWKLLEPVHSKAENFCRRLAGNRDDGDDLYLESIMTALAKLDTLREDAAFKPWFYRIVVNRYRNYRRASWWRSAGSDILERSEPPAHDPSERYAARRYLKIALSALKHEERALIVLYELEDWSIGELAELFVAPEGTIKARLSRARQKMRKALIPLIPQGSNDLAREDGYELPESSATAE